MDKELLQDLVVYLQLRDCAVPLARMLTRQHSSLGSNSFTIVLSRSFYSTLGGAKLHMRYRCERVTLSTWAMSMPIHLLIACRDTTSEPNYETIPSSASPHHHT
ncbi:hypothetical protein IG631_10650 [Alternaria alternata]|nr:hypothetical protein IG631_10650 [Alternaria alternata]